MSVAEELCAEAEALERCGDQARAHEKWAAAACEARRSTRILNGLGRSHMLLGHLAEAEAILRQASVLDPEAGESLSYSPTHLAVLLGGEAGLRCGEIMALEWTDIDLTKRQLCAARSEWKGHVTMPKGGRLRYVPTTKRLTDAFRNGRHLRGPRVSCNSEGKPLTQKIVQVMLRRAARRANVKAGLCNPSSHVLLTSGDAWSPGAGHPGVGRTSGFGDNAPVHAPEPGGDRRRDRTFGGEVERSAVSEWRNSGGGGKMRPNPQIP
jgi:hypothetical protein